MREPLYNRDDEKRARMLTDFVACNKAGVDAAVSLAEGDFFKRKHPADYSAKDVYTAIFDIINRKE